MQENLKLQIIAAATDYAKKNKLTNTDVATKAKINPSYISALFRNIFTINVNDQPVEIADKYFYQLAEFAGIPLKKNYWPTIHTVQFTELISALEGAKKSGRVSCLICPTGFGKTFCVDKFVHLNPTHTYKITVSDSHTLVDILREILDAMNLEHSWSTPLKLKAIADRCKDLRRSGFKPQIILDESENLKHPVIKSLKALYDIMNGYGSITLIGTSQLIKNLERMKKRDRAGVPQFFRRIKASIRYVNPHANFAPFFTEHGIEKPLQKILNSLCENYGELHDYLEPALREADEREEPLTENLFRLMYNMPKY